MPLSFLQLDGTPFWTERGSQTTQLGGGSLWSMPARFSITAVIDTPEQEAALAGALLGYPISIALPDGTAFTGIVSGQGRPRPRRPYRAALEIVEAVTALGGFMPPVTPAPPAGLTFEPFVDELGNVLLDELGIPFGEYVS